MRLFSRFLVIAASLTACGATAPGMPAVAIGPPFDPIAFFDGRTQSSGVVEDRSGAPTEHIATYGDAYIDAENRLHMMQHLCMQGGEMRDRTWTLWRTGLHRFNATASDMIGTATGESDGGTFHWRWVWARSPGNPLMNVTMEQWMYGLPDRSALIRTTVSKFGIILAEVTEHFSHAEGAAQPDAASIPPGCALPTAEPHA
jgi:hypothetical protein